MSSVPSGATRMRDVLREADHPPGKNRPKRPTISAAFDPGRRCAAPACCASAARSGRARDSGSPDTPPTSGDQHGAAHGRDDHEVVERGRSSRANVDACGGRNSRRRRKLVHDRLRRRRARDRGAAAPSSRRSNSSSTSAEPPRITPHHVDAVAARARVVAKAGEQHAIDDAADAPRRRLDQRQPQIERAEAWCRRGSARCGRRA